MAGACLLKLPPELIHRTALYLPAKDWSNLRLTCRETADAARYTAFQQMCFRITDNFSMNHLEKIATNNTLRSKVRTLWLLDARSQFVRPVQQFVSDLVQKYGNTVDIQDEVSALPKDMLELERAWEQVWATEMLMMEHTFETLLRKILLHFSIGGSLQDIKIVSTDFSCANARALLDNCDEAVRRTELELIEEEYIRDFAAYGSARMARRLETETNSCFMGSMGSPREMREPSPIIYDTIAHLQLNLRSLDLGNQNEPFGIGQFCKSKQYWPSSLKELRLWTSPGMKKFNNRESPVFPAFVLFMSSLKNLEYLFLHVDIVVDCWPKWADMATQTNSTVLFHRLASQTFDDGSPIDIAPHARLLPKLRQFVLIEQCVPHLCIPPDSILDFLRLRKSTLEDVQVQRIHPEPDCDTCGKDLLLKASDCFLWKPEHHGVPAEE
jgi:hypothetical protein